MQPAEPSCASLPPLYNHKAQVTSIPIIAHGLAGWQQIEGKVWKDTKKVAVIL
jgi:hypothetical protein